MKKLSWLCCLWLAWLSGIAFAQPPNAKIVIENAELRLTLSADARARSLIHKPTRQECLANSDQPAFTLTQYRPYNNELQLAYPAKSAAFAADSVRREGDLLVVNFGIVDYEARIRLRVADAYIAFTLEKLIYKNTPGYRKKPATPVDELCFLQLPIKPRRNFGDWLNVMWDGQVAVNLLATDPFAKIDGAPYADHHRFSAAAVNEVKLEGVGAALIATKTENLLDRIATVERDFDLPRGADSRRRPEYRWSYYELVNVSPKEIDRHIAYARQAGFKAMMIYNLAFAKSVGHFGFKPEFPNGLADLKLIVDKIKQAGMIAGLHFHYNKATKNDPYVEANPDARLNLTKILTLKEPLNASATTITVDENPRGAPMEDERRFLKIGDELIAYESCTNEPPYQFLGCQRGQLKTQPVAHAAGLKMGVLDVDTWPIFVRFDQRTSIQGEVAERIGQIYREAGFQFVYFDGAEDVHPPYWFTVSWPQLLVHRRLQPEPLFAEGACKSHFSWHILTRGNAFDVFMPEVLKAATRDNPLAEAERVARDFTAINFGWTGYWSPSKETIGIQPDMLEYATSRAVAWDCPISLNGELAALDAHPRTPDNLEVLRRWEELRVKNSLTARQKAMLRDPRQEHTLLVNEAGETEIVPYEQIANAAGGDAAVRAFVFERKGKVCIVYWHTSGEGRIKLALPGSRIRLMGQFGRDIAVQASADSAILPVGKRRYLETDGLTKQQVIAAFQQTKLLGNR